MNNEYFSLAIHKQIALINTAISRVIELTGDAPTFPQAECPLRTEIPDNHHKNSQILFGIGEKRWTCLFCGTTEHI